MALGFSQQVLKQNAKAPECRAGLQARRASTGPRRSVCVKAADESKRSTLDSLDSLLGSATQDDKQEQRVEWWRVRPKQEAPPRTTSISNSRNPSGRFIANEEMLRNEVWAGAKTAPGQAIELPKVTPYLSYAIALVDAAVYGTLVRVSVTQGPEAAAELLASVGFSRGAVVEQGELWRLLSGLVVHGGLGPMAVVLMGMLAVAPRVEASLGYRTFTAAYLLSALAAADTIIALGGGGAVSAAASSLPSAAAAAATSASGGGGGGDLLAAMLHPAGADVMAAVTSAAAGGGAGGVAGGLGLGLGALGAVMGIAGAAAAHEVVNGRVEQTAGSSRSASTSGASTSGSSSGDAAHGHGRSGAGGAASGAGAIRVDAGAVLLVVSGVAAALPYVQEAGGAGAGALLASLAAGFGTGFALAATAGPRYQVTREVDLPDGSMWIPDPDNVQEYTVVLDRTTAIQRSLVTGLMALALGGASLSLVLGAAAAAGGGAAAGL